MFSKALALFAIMSCAAAVPVLEERAACSPLELVFARGTNENGLGSVGAPLSTSLASLVSGTTYYNVDFPSTAEYSTTVKQGATDAASHITAQVAACPDQLFALAGYSKGAMVIHLTTLSAAVQKKVIAVAVFGDPYRTSGDTFPIDSQSSAVGYCNTGDPICQNGSNLAAHLTYGTDGSATKAAQFIAKLYNAA